MEKHIAVYLRVSSKNQDTRSQEPDLKRWAQAQDKPVTWHGDKFTGKTMAWPGWSKLEADIRAGKVFMVVCWRLDRLGRTAKGLTALFQELQDRRVGLVSIREGLDLPLGFRHPTFELRGLLKGSQQKALAFAQIVGKKVGALHVTDYGSNLTKPAIRSTSIPNSRLPP